MGTDTGRLSCSQLNRSNVPRTAEEIVPRPGGLLIIGEQPGGPGPRPPYRLRSHWTIARKLNEWFMWAGFEPWHVLSVNFVNVIPEWTDGPITAELVAANRPELARSIALCAPSVIVTLGRLAVDELIGPGRHDFRVDGGRT